jgi:hypothetical protein
MEGMEPAKPRMDFIWCYIPCVNGFAQMEGNALATDASRNGVSSVFAERMTRLHWWSILPERMRMWALFSKVLLSVFIREAAKLPAVRTSVY